MPEPQSRQWLDKQLKRQLPGHHFMLTFTVPQELRPFLRSHQRIGYSALFTASSEAIKRLATDPLTAGNPGLLRRVAHLGRQLQYHPHIHYVVPGGMLASQDGRWHPAAVNFYLPVQALSKIVRAKFRDRMAKAGLLADIPAVVWRTDWNVNSQPSAAPRADQVPHPLRLSSGDLQQPHRQGRKRQGLHSL